MRAHVGDRIILAADHVDQPTRDGKIVEVRGADGGPPFLVEWSDGHTGLIFPGPGSILRIGLAEGAEAGEIAPAKPAAPKPAAPRPAAAASGGTQAHTEGPGHVREWQIRVSIFEAGDETSANVVLVADAPEHLSARGEARRSKDDTSVPEIGDEVAVARALRHLADKLMEAAETDIEMLTGEEAHVRPL
jgi:hypothetical protein